MLCLCLAVSELQKVVGALWWTCNLAGSLETKKQQVKIVIVIVIEPDGSFETPGRQRGLDWLKPAFDVVQQHGRFFCEHA